MLSDLPSSKEIRAATELLLRKAGARGRFPTPVDDIVAAAGLTEAKESLLASSLLDRAPAHLRSVLERARLKVEALLDRRSREIHLSRENEKESRRGFKKLHEVSHDIYSWQAALAYADDARTLSPSTNDLFEREANQGAAELFFQGTFFETIAGDYQVGFPEIIELAEKIGPSIRSTLRQFVETSRDSVAGVVLDLSPLSLEPMMFGRQEVMHSELFTRRFGHRWQWPASISVEQVPLLAEARLTPNKIATGEVALSAISSSVVVRAEVFNNCYNLMILLWQPKRRFLKRGKRILAGSDQ